MKKFIALIQKIKFELITAFSLIAVMISSVAFVYAWMSPIVDVAETNNMVGIFDSNLDVKYWNKSSSNTNKWENPVGSDAVIFGLGEMLSIAELPSDSNAYLKFTMSDPEVPHYNFNVLLQTIAISVSNISGPKTVPDIDYYSGTPTQRCFDYYYVVGDNNIYPATLFGDLGSLTKYQFTTTNQEIAGEYIDPGNWLYIMIKPRLTETQNIIRKIPIEYSPYQLTFTLSFNGETRTID